MTAHYEEAPAALERTRGENHNDINHPEDIEMTNTNATNTAAARPTWAATFERTNDGDGLEFSVAKSSTITLEHDADVSVCAEQWVAYAGARRKVEPAAIVVTDRGDGAEQDIIVRSAAAARDLAAALLQLADTLDGERPTDWCAEPTTEGRGGGL